MLSYYMSVIPLIHVGTEGRGNGRGRYCCKDTVEHIFYFFTLSGGLFLDKFALEYIDSCESRASRLINTYVL